MTKTISCNAYYHYEILIYCCINKLRGIQNTSMALHLWLIRPNITYHHASFPTHVFLVSCRAHVSQRSSLYKFSSSSYSSASSSFHLMFLFSFTIFLLFLFLLIILSHDFPHHIFLLLFFIITISLNALIFPYTSSFSSSPSPSFSLTSWLSLAHLTLRDGFLLCHPSAEQETRQVYLLH